MSAHIEVPATASRYSAEFRQWVDSLGRVVDQAEQQKAVGDQIALGGDWASLATELGVTAEQAEAVYNLLGSVVVELHGTFITQMVGRLG